MRILSLILFVAGCTGSSTLDTRVRSEPLQHRAAAGTCPGERPAAGCTAQVFAMDCHADSECSDGTNGRCNGNAHDGCSCSYDECFTDAECPGGQVCDCRGAWHYGASGGPNRCMPANCKTDSDCGPGNYCSPSLDPVCGQYLGVAGWYCHTDKDDCTNDSDCGADGSFQWSAPFCSYRPEVGRWTCSTSGCAG
jgi:hypothetical protein